VLDASGAGVACPAGILLRSLKPMRATEPPHYELQHVGRLAGIYYKRHFDPRSRAEKLTQSRKGRIQQSSISM
jgi:hypothetical protein